MNLNNEPATATWRKSSHSGSNGGNCVEVAPLSGARVAVRDSKQYGQGPVLIFGSKAWAAFIDDLSHQRTDL
jgi:hypothetical protein